MRRPKSPNIVQMSVRFSLDTYHALEKIAEKEQRTICNTIRRIVNTHPSIAEAMADKGKQRK